MARITAFSPGQSPPPVSTPTRMSSTPRSADLPESTLAPEHTFAWWGSRTLPVCGSELVVRPHELVERADEAVPDGAREPAAVPEELRGGQHDVDPGQHQVEDAVCLGVEQQAAEELHG